MLHAAIAENRFNVFSEQALIPSFARIAKPPTTVIPDHLKNQPLLSKKFTKLLIYQLVQKVPLKASPILLSASAEKKKKIQVITGMNICYLIR